MQIEKMKDNENAIISEFLNQLLTPIIKKTVEEVLSINQGIKNTVDDDEIGVVEAAILLRCSEGHIYNLNYRREIPSYRKGKGLLFSRKTLKEWDEKRKKTRNLITQ